MEPKSVNDILELLSSLSNPPKARYPEFDNEQDAIAYAVRLSQLKPGDTVHVGNTDSDLFPVVFYRPIHDVFVQCLRVNPKNNDVEVATCPLTCLWFPDMITKN